MIYIILLQVTINNYFLFVLLFAWGYFMFFIFSKKSTLIFIIFQSLLFSMDKESMAKFFQNQSIKNLEIVKKNIDPRIYFLLKIINLINKNVCYEEINDYVEYSSKKIEDNQFLEKYQFNDGYLEKINITKKFAQEINLSIPDLNNNEREDKICKYINILYKYAKNGEYQDEACEIIEDPELIKILDNSFNKIFKQEDFTESLKKLKQEKTFNVESISEFNSIANLIFFLYLKKTLKTTRLSSCDDSSMVIDQTDLKKQTRNSKEYYQLYNYIEYCDLLEFFGRLCKVNIECIKKFDISDTKQDFKSEIIFYAENCLEKNSIYDLNKSCFKQPKNQSCENRISVIIKPHKLNQILIKDYPKHIINFREENVEKNKQALLKNNINNIDEKTSEYFFNLYGSFDYFIEFYDNPGDEYLTEYQQNNIFKIKHTDYFSLYNRNIRQITLFHQAIFNENQDEVTSNPKYRKLVIEETIKDLIKTEKILCIDKSFYVFGNADEIYINTSLKNLQFNENNFNNLVKNGSVLLQLDLFKKYYSKALNIEYNNDKFKKIIMDKEKSDGTFYINDKLLLLCEIVLPDIAKKTLWVRPFFYNLGLHENKIQSRNILFFNPEHHKNLKNSFNFVMYHFNRLNTTTTDIERIKANYNDDKKLTFEIKYDSDNENIINKYQIVFLTSCFSASTGNAFYTI